MSYNNDKDILSFEFSLSRKDVQSYLDSSKSNTNDKVWLNVKVCLKTDKAIFATTGRQYQEDVVEKKQQNRYCYYKFKVSSTCKIS